MDRSGVRHSSGSYSPSLFVKKYLCSVISNIYHDSVFNIDLRKTEVSNYLFGVTSSIYFYHTKIESMYIINENGLDVINLSSIIYFIYIPKYYTDCLEMVKNELKTRKLYIDMLKITELIIRKKTNKMICWV